jgi:hypothetical protein
MRIVQGAALCGAFLSGVALPALGQSPDATRPPDATRVLAAARDALGGDATLQSVKTFVATGRTRQLRGNNLVPIEFEINCELPDKFVRKDEIPAQDTDITVAGFRGDELIQSPSGRGGARGGPAGAPQQRVATLKQDFVRLTLGAFATSFPTFPLTFKYAAEAEAPEGKADVLDVTGPANFAARLLVQRDTHLPVMLMWQMPAGAARGRDAAPGPPPGAAAGAPPPPPPPGAPPAPPRGGPPPAAEAEHRLYYGDYRPVNGGIKWPFRIRHAVAGTTVEETIFDRVAVNVKIDPRKFEAPK